MSGVQTQRRLCETNPICPEPDASQVPCDTEVMSDSARNGPRKTNPICESMELEAMGAAGSASVRAYSSTSVWPAVQSHGQDARATHGQDGRATQGRDEDPKRDLSRLGTHAHATAPPRGGAPSEPATEGPACRTNPISFGVQMGQVPCGTLAKRMAGQQS